MAEIEAKCQCCGKPVSVLEPSRWGYKVKGKNGWIYYCSWKCLRADEKRIEQAQKKKQEARKAKQQEKIRNDRLEVMKGMMEAVSEGKNAYDYLKSMGYADPKDTLRRLRITAKEEAPKIYRKMEKMGLLDLRKGHSGKGADRMSQNKLTREQKEKAVQIALNGGDYLEHLKKCGAKNPSAAWWYIRKTLGKSNPELLEEINRKTGEEAEVEVAEKLPPEASQEKNEKEQMYESMGVPAELATEEPKDELKGFVPFRTGPVAMTREEHAETCMSDQCRVVIDKNGLRVEPPVSYDGFDVVCIRGEFGEYRTDGKKIHFENPAKIMFFEIHKEDLAAFLEEVRRAAQILGVDAG